MNKKTVLFLLAIFLGTAVTMAAVSQDSPRTLLDGEYKILKGQIVKIEAKGINRVLVVEKDTLTVVKAEATFVELMGAKSGDTLVEVFVGTGKRTYKVTVEDKDMDELSDKVTSLLTGQLKLIDLKISRNALTGKILIEGDLLKDDLDKVTKILEPYKDYVENFLKVKESEDVVEIDAEIVEIGRDAARTLGMKLPTQFSFGETQSDVFSGAGYQGTTKDLSGAASSNVLFDFMHDYSRTSLAAAISLMEQEGKAQILSKPRLACLSGKDAELVVGGEVPVMTTGIVSGGGASNSVDYKEYGIKLKVSPTVTADNKIEVKMNVEVSDVGQSQTLGGSTATALAYPVTKRSTSTTMLMEENQTLTISGLIAQKSDESLAKFPWLADIPVLGVFFKQKTERHGGGSGARGDMELVIMMTPKIIKAAKHLKPEDLNPKVQAAPVTKAQGYQDQPAAELLSYTKRVRDEIVRALTYPYDAQEAGWQANVVVKLHISRDGTLIDSTMVESSGYKIFDGAVMKAIQNVPKYPAFPSDINDKDLWVEVPIMYSMK